MKKVMVFGTFDLLHGGHIDFLKQAKRYGDELIVVVGRDSNVFKAKKKQPIYDAEKRKKALESLNIVDNVMIGEKEDFFLPIKTLRPDIICLGYDQNDMGILKRKEEFNIEIKRMRPFNENMLKSSKLREKMDLNNL